LMMALATGYSCPASLPLVVASFTLCMLPQP
jgi:hypothetical protein